MRILLTGASKGLGAALAQRFASHFQSASTLELAGRDEARLASVAAACRAHGAQARTASFSLTERSALRDWIRDADARAPIDLAISNAGVLLGNETRSSLESAEATAEQIAVNLTSAAIFLNESARVMAPRGRGHLVAISSLAGIQPKADEIAYSASKAGLNAYCEALRDYLSNSGVTVSLICPGYVETGMGADKPSARPFEWSVERAADRIFRAILARKPYDAFPPALAWGSRLGRLLPRRLRRLATDRLRLPR